MCYANAYHLSNDIKLGVYLRCVFVQHVFPFVIVMQRLERS